MDKTTFELYLKASKFFGSCRNKGQYHSEEEASKAITLLFPLEDTRKKYTAYPCANCNGWHVIKRLTQNELKLVAELTGK